MYDDILHSLSELTGITSQTLDGIFTAALAILLIALAICAVYSRIVRDIRAPKYPALNSDHDQLGLMTAGLHADKQSLKERLQNAEARALKAEEELKALKASLKR